MGYGSLQKRTDLARIPLNLPLFSKTSLVTPHVYSVEHLFATLYAVRDYPEKPHNTYPDKHVKIPLRSVKTRRKPLVSNKVYLQMAGSTRGRDGLTLQGVETGSCCILKVRKEEIKNKEFNIEKNTNKGNEKRISSLCPLRLCGEIKMSDRMKDGFRK